MQDLPLAIIFDLDGTLVDNTKIVVETYMVALKRLGRVPPSFETIAKLGGLSVKETAKALGLSGKLVEKMDVLFWEIFPQILKTKCLCSSLFPGIPELLSFLSSQGVKMGIVTSNRVENARYIVKATNIDSHFPVIIGYDSIDEPKPSPQPLRLAIEGLSIPENDVSPKTVWFVGDSATDVQTAHNANVFAVAIPHQSRLNSVLDANPDLLLASALDLLSYLTREHPFSSNTNSLQDSLKNADPMDDARPLRQNG